MNAVNLDSKNHDMWSELLRQAVSQPGLMLKAYSAFHGYSLGNQLAALLQCNIRYVEFDRARRVFQRGCGKKRRENYST